MTASPDIVLDGSEHRLHPRVQGVWIIERSVLLFAAGAVLTVIMGTRDGTRAVAILVGAATLLVAVLAAVSAKLSWRNWHWSAWPDALELRHGVISQRASLVPYERIQQIDLHRTPVDRVLGLSRLILRTAAATTDATIPGIAAEHAESLRHQLLARAGADDAV